MNKEQNFIEETFEEYMKNARNEFVEEVDQ